MPAAVVTGAAQVAKALARTAAVALVVVLATSALAGEATRSALALVPAPAGRLPAATIEALCARLAPRCTAASTKARVASSARDGRLYLLDDAQPWLAMLDERDPADATRARVFDFSARPHSTPPAADGGAVPSLRLHPALYPVGADGWAVAIVSTSREMYSGGGAFFDVADFVALDTAATPRVLYAAVPFACSKTIRACFSRKEYARSPHCTDDSAGHLTIVFAGGRGGSPAWSFTWHEQSWPANVGQSKQRWTHVPFAVPAGPRDVEPGAAAELAAFCGGPVS